MKTIKQVQTIILTGICFLFWQNELKYSLPTPVPANYKHVKVGSHIDLGKKLQVQNGKPIFIHFLIPTVPVHDLIFRMCVHWLLNMLTGSIL